MVISARQVGQIWKPKPKLKTPTQPKKSINGFNRNRIKSGNLNTEKLEGKKVQKHYLNKYKSGKISLNVSKYKLCL